MRLIRFFSERENLGLGKPVPMKDRIPAWYRDSESTFSVNGGPESAGIKKCMPFMDTLVSGYTYTTPFDIYVARKEDGELDLRWNGPDSLSEFVGQRPDELGALMPRPAGHLKNHLVWKGFWNVKTPRGYSLLFTHPLNRYDLPFTTGSAIVDSDEFWAPGNIPFSLKEDFVGVIPEGTPFCHLIPIKRDHWKMIEDAGQKGQGNELGSIARKPETLYKRIMWHRKKYD
jgi:hypothetical protein